MKVGLIAHDSKKKLMQNFCIAYRGILTRHELYATGTTGTLVEEVTNLKIHKFLPGETGGARQLASFLKRSLSGKGYGTGSKFRSQIMRYLQYSYCHKSGNRRIINSRSGTW